MFTAFVLFSLKTCFASFALRFDRTAFNTDIWVLFDGRTRRPQRDNDNDHGLSWADVSADDGKARTWAILIQNLRALRGELVLLNRQLFERVSMQEKE